MDHLIQALLPLIGLLVLLAIVAAVLRAFAGKSRKVQGLPYEKADALFSPAERSFLGVLEQALGDQYRVLGKVRLADVIRVKRGLGRPAWQSAFNRIQSKHLDFVVCDPADLSVQFAVELDDSSHAKSKRQSRDTFLGQALEAAEVPFFRFQAKRAYSVQEIQGRILESSDEP